MAPIRMACAIVRDAAPPSHHRQGGWSATEPKIRVVNCCENDAPDLGDMLATARKIMADPELPTKHTHVILVWKGLEPFKVVQDWSKILELAPPEKFHARSSTTSSLRLRCADRCPLDLWLVPHLLTGCTKRSLTGCETFWHLRMC